MAPSEETVRGFNQVLTGLGVAQQDPGWVSAVIMQVRQAIIQTVDVRQPGTREQLIAELRPAAQLLLSRVTPSSQLALAEGHGALLMARLLG
eukprot:2088158-Lingulodinium_polyedra.AAC.1